MHARAELTRLRTETGDVAAASGHLERCEAILAGGEDWRGLAGTVTLARAVLGTAAGANSGVGYAESVETFTAFQLPWRRADALLAWAVSLREAGDLTGAAVHREAALECFERIGAATRWRTTAG